MVTHPTDASATEAFLSPSKCIQSLLTAGNPCLHDVGPILCYVSTHSELSSDILSINRTLVYNLTIQYVSKQKDWHSLWRVAIEVDSDL